MALERPKTRWIVAIILIIALVVLIDWLANRHKQSSAKSNKDLIQNGTGK